jgi:hypothetical protein
MLAQKKSPRRCLYTKNFCAFAISNPHFEALSSVEKITATERVQLREFTAEL